MRGESKTPATKITAPTKANVKDNSTQVIPAKLVTPQENLVSDSTTLTRNNITEPRNDTVDILETVQQDET